jgi:hypothetical protein
MAVRTELEHDKLTGGLVHVHYGLPPLKLWNNNWTTSYFRPDGVRVMTHGDAGTRFDRNGDAKPLHSRPPVHRQF